MNLVGGTAARGADRTCHQAGPGLDVAGRISNDGWLSGRSARCVDAHDLVHRNREHPERIVLSEIVLAGERKPREVIELFQIARMNAGRVELSAVVRHSLIAGV